MTQAACSATGESIAETPNGGGGGNGGASANAEAFEPIQIVPDIGLRFLDNVTGHGYGPSDLEGRLTERPRAPPDAAGPSFVLTVARPWRANGQGRVRRECCPAPWWA